MACSADLDFYNARQCFGIKPTVMIVTAPTSTVTLLGPTCSQRVEYALYTPTGNRATQLRVPNAVDNIQLLQPSALLASLAPAQTGSVAQIGATAIQGRPNSFAGSQTGRPARCRQITSSFTAGTS